MKEKQVNMKASLQHVKARGGARSATQEMMEEYVMQCEKAIKTGQKTDLPKTLHTKLEEKIKLWRRRVLDRMRQELSQRLVLQHLQQRLQR